MYAALTTGARISAIVGPAGSGKTYLQRAITAAWTARTVDADQPGNRRGARAGAEPDRGAACWPTRPARGRRTSPSGCTSTASKPSGPQTLPHATKTYRPDPAWTLQPGQLVIVDEASMVTTRELDAILSAVRKADAKLLLVGDDKQLGAHRRRRHVRHRRRPHQRAGAVHGAPLPRRARAAARLGMRRLPRAA